MNSQIEEYRKKQQEKYYNSTSNKYKNKKKSNFNIISLSSSSSSSSSSYSYHRKCDSDESDSDESDSDESDTDERDTDESNTNESYKNNCKINYNTNIINSHKTTKNKIINRKKPIPSTIKRLVWNTYIGENIGKSKCYCCRLSDITQLSFHCGHVLSEKNGGKINVDNLRPICQNCNSSMGIKNMFDFINEYNIHK